MDFILGIFTGATLVILLGIWLNEKEKNRKKAALPSAKDLMDLENSISDHPQAKINEHWIRFNEWDRLFNHQRPLKQQLSDAIAREDFKEAARLRDLINKK